MRYEILVMMVRMRLWCVDRWESTRNEQQQRCAEEQQNRTAEKPVVAITEQYREREGEKKQNCSRTTE
jgi:hypothetical protein